MARELVRNLAKALEVDEQLMWQWIEIERRKAATPIAAGQIC